MKSIAVFALAASCSALRVAAPSRRSALQTFAAAASLPTALLPARCIAADDPLLTRLAEARAGLVTSLDEFDAEQFDSVRRAIKTAVTPLTMRGYLGVSVKTRAQESGSEDLANARVELLRNLGTVDQYCYQRQSAAPWDKPADPAPAATALKEAVATIDRIVKLL